MDPEMSCQDVERCQICDKDIAELFCVYCETKLCKRCIGGHLAEDPEKHKIVKNHDKYTTLVLPICATHSQKRCKNFCEQCHQAVCSSCISSKLHERHKFLEIEDIFNKKKKIIANDTKELEQEILPSYEEIVKQVEFNELDSEINFEFVLSEIEEQGRKWHQEIDRIEKTLKSEVGSMKKMQMKAHSEHLQRLKKLLLDVKQSIHLNKHILGSLEISRSLSYESMNAVLKTLPPKLEISVPRFIPKAIENELNLEKVGVITGFCISSKEGVYRLKSHSGPVFRDNGEGNVKISKRILKEPVVSLFEPNIRDLRSVACTKDGKLWVSGEKGPIQLFDCDPLVNVSRPSFIGMLTYLSVILKNIPADKGIKDIAVTTTGDLVYGKLFSKKICIFRNGKTDELINLDDWSLLSFCTTSNDDLLVCMIDAKRLSCRVVRFEGSEERQIIQYNNEGEKLFALGKGKKYVRENRNGDVCVADYDGNAVVVTNKKGAFKFRYTRGRFPLGIATDSHAHLIVPYSEQIHIIDMNGCFQRYLKTFFLLFEGISLAIDTDDNLYFVENNGIVRKIRYLK